MAKSEDALFHVHPARSSQDITTATALIKAYADTLGFDLSYQDFGSEISQMPGRYAHEQGGELLLAIKNDTHQIHNHNHNSNSTRFRREHDECGCVYSPSDVLGCVALRALPSSTPSESSCEIKRLYILPSARRMGIGRVLINALITKARESGYSRMCLDTLSSMQSAISLYESLGFEEIEAYYDGQCPEEGTVYLALNLN